MEDQLRISGYGAGDERDINLLIFTAVKDELGCAYTVFKVFEQKQLALTDKEEVLFSHGQGSNVPSGIDRLFSEFKNVASRLERHLAQITSPHSGISIWRPNAANQPRVFCVGCISLVGLLLKDALIKH